MKPEPIPPSIAAKADRSFASLAGRIAQLESAASIDRETIVALSRLLTNTNPSILGLLQRVSVLCVDVSEMEVSTTSSAQWEQVFDQLYQLAVDARAAMQSTVEPNET